MTDRAIDADRSNKQQSSENQRCPTSMDDYERWESTHQDELDRRHAARNQKYNRKEAERFAAAKGAIFDDLKKWRKIGLTRDEAFSVMVHRWSKGGPYTYTDLVEILRGMGCKFGAPVPHCDHWGNPLV